MGVFRKLKELRAFEKRQLPLLTTPEDFDIVLEIGYHQEAGIPFTLTQLSALGIGSLATVNRRMRRLKELGLVRQRPAAHDRRMIFLTLCPDLQHVFRKYGRLLASS